ncbi:MAG TPA: hypothetical protein VLS53_01370 [Candidatus Dormibacteraeota bacterium]|nr:hypothetical protein [Candidatus Dormibacteraeota bacterium]
MRYSIKEDGSAVSVELTEVDGKQDELLKAFGDCQAGQCSCPTDEYQKLATMDVNQADNQMSLRLEAKPGEKFDVSEIANCLDYTTAELSRRHKSSEADQP